MRFSEEYGIQHIVKSADNAAGIVGDSINMAKVHHVCFIIATGAITGDTVLTVNSGATAAAKTTALTFNYRLAGADQAAAGADIYGAWATSAALTMTAATYDNKITIVEVDASEMTAAEPWLTLDLSSAASALNVSVVSITYNRDVGLTMPTVLA